MNQINNFWKTVLLMIAIFSAGLLIGRNMKGNNSTVKDTAGDGEHNTASKPGESEKNTPDNTKKE